MLGIMKSVKVIDVGRDFEFIDELKDGAKRVGRSAFG